MQAIAEVPSFIRLAEKLLSEDERQDLIRFLAEHPKAGDLIEDSGGASCAGVAVAGARAVACGLFTTSTATSCRYTC